MNIKQTQEELKKTLDALNKAHAILSKVRGEVPAQEKTIPDPRLDRFKQAEYLAHILPYEIQLDSAPKKVVIIAGDKTEINTDKTPVIDEDGIERFYNIKKVQTNNEGLVCFILYADEADNPRVQVIFRGTHNKASIRRDLETFGSGPGSISFKKNKHTIMQDIKQIVQHKQNTGTANVELGIAGHSLGGADAQMCATEVLKDIADNPSVNPLAQVAQLNIMHANSAGVSYTTGKTAQRSLEKIKESNHRLHVKQHIIHVGGDAVQQSGYTTILSKSSCVDVETNLLRADLDPKFNKMADLILIFKGKIKKLLGLNTYEAHIVIFFHGKKYDLDIKFRVYSNQTPGENLEISKQLKHKVLARFYKAISPSKNLKRIKHLIYGSLKTKNDKERKNKHKNKPKSSDLT